MKFGSRMWSWSAVCAAVLVFCSTTVASADMRIAITGFKNNADCSYSEAEAASRALVDMMTRELTRVPGLAVYERAALDAIATEQRLALSGLVDSTTAVQIGRLAGVQWIVTGAITQLSYKRSGGDVYLPIPGFGTSVSAGEKKAVVGVDMRVIDVETGQVRIAVEESATATRSSGGFSTYYVGFSESEEGGMVLTACHEVAKKLSKLLADEVASRGYASSNQPMMQPQQQPVQQQYVQPVQQQPVQQQYVQPVQQQPAQAQPMMPATQQPQGYTNTMSPYGQQPAQQQPAQQQMVMPASGGSDIANTSEEMAVIDTYPIDQMVKSQIQMLHKGGYYNYSRGEYRKAYEAFKRALDTYNGNYLDAYWAARSAHKAGMRKEMREMLDIALSINPMYEPAARYKAENVK